MFLQLFPLRKTVAAWSVTAGANLPSSCNKSVQNQMMDPSPHLLNTLRERLSNFQNWFSNTRCHLRRFRNILSSSRKQKFGFSGLPNIRYGGLDCYIDPCWGSSSFRDSAKCNLIVQLEGTLKKWLPSLFEMKTTTDNAFRCKSSWRSQCVGFPKRLLQNNQWEIPPPG